MTTHAVLHMIFNVALFLFITVMYFRNKNTKKHIQEMEEFIKSSKR